MSKFQIRNMTPHVINIFLSSGNSVSLEPESVSARCEEVDYEVGSVNGIPVIKKQFGVVHNLPDPEPGVIYVTSIVVAQAVRKTRNDVFVVAGLVRDGGGRVVGCTALARLDEPGGKFD